MQIIGEVFFMRTQTVAIEVWENYIKRIQKDKRGEDLSEIRTIRDLKHMFAS